jgi:hypothetical protein
MTLKEKRSGPAQLSRNNELPLIGYSSVPPFTAYAQRSVN